MEQIIYSQIFDILTELNVCPAPRSSRSFDAIPTAATSVVPN